MSKAEMHLKPPSRFRAAAAILAVFICGILKTPVVAAGEVDQPIISSSSEQPTEIYYRGHWEFELESNYHFLSVPNPFFGVYGIRNQNPLHYRLATEILSAQYEVTQPHTLWFLPGALELSASVVGSAIVHGPESHFIGFALGARYYFVRPQARLVPYMEVRVGPGQTDSRGFKYAQQQDLTFTYLLGMGLRYDVNKVWSASLSAVDQHISNAYLTQPNYGFDTVGLSVGLIRRF